MTERDWLVLVVDDDSDVRHALRIALEGQGFDVQTAESAEDGLRSYITRRPDAVVVDLMMEEVDSGTWLVRELSLKGDTPPIFMLSSVGDSLHSSVDYGTLGLSGVFQKPVDPVVLAQALRAALE